MFFSGAGVAGNQQQGLKDEQKVRRELIAQPAALSHHLAYLLHRLYLMCDYPAYLFVYLFVVLLPRNVKSVRASTVAALCADFTECLAQNRDSRNTC